MQEHLMTSIPSISYKLLLLLLSYAVCAMAYPVGISLGQTYLTSAYYTQANELVAIVSVIASEEWRSYFAKTWEEPQNQASLKDSEIRTLFKNTLYQVQAATEAALNRTIIVNSIVAPQHFRTTPSLRLLMEVAVEEGFATYYHQVTCALNGARLAYNLDSCTGFGLQPGEPCNIDNGDNFVMNVNYDRNRLSLGIVNVGVYFCVPYNIRHYEQYGEMSGSILDPTRLDNFSKDLIVYLDAFAEEQLERWSVPQALKGLRAIVLSGEASESGMAEMRLALTATLPSEFEHKFRTSLDPLFVGAFGAAQRARHIVQNPDFLKPNPGYFLPGNPEGHKEL